MRTSPNSEESRLARGGGNADLREVGRCRVPCALGRRRLSRSAYSPSRKVEVAEPSDGPSP
jgi:hypothetical protein